MNKKVLWGLLILLSSALLFSGELQDTITPDTTAVDTVSIPNVNPSTKTNKPHFSIGYNLGVCYRGNESNNINTYSYSGDFRLLPDISNDFNSEFYFLHNIEISVKLPFKTKILETGIGYSFSDVYSGMTSELDFETIQINGSFLKDSTLGRYYHEKLHRVYIFSALDIYKNIMIGAELIYDYTDGEEQYTTSDDIYGFSTVVPNVKKILLGGGIYLKICNTDKDLLNNWFNPYFILKVSGANEIYSDSPYKELWPEKLTHWYAGCYLGFAIGN